MARIPEDELERLKAEVSLQRLAEAKGVELKRHGADLLGRCPFHDDRTPSLVISPKKNLWHCLGACQAGGSVVDWVMRSEGVSFRHAVELLRADLPLTAGPPPKVGTVRRLPAPVATDAKDREALRQVVEYYHATLKQSPEALHYLDRRGLRHPELVERFQLGFANRTLGLRLPQGNRKAGADVRSRLQRILAQHRGDEPGAYVRRAADAWANFWHIDHDLEANAFFVAAAADARSRPGEGLYHWVGEAACRSIYRAQRSAVTPDGFGRYLMPGGELVFLLEWDRNTESPPRLRRKFKAYLDHFGGRRGASLTNVLVVAPSLAREEIMRETVASLVGGVEACSFFLSHVPLIGSRGVCEEVWLPLGGGARLALSGLPLRSRSSLVVEDCIAQSGWWERRVGGGERS